LTALAKLAGPTCQTGTLFLFSDEYNLPLLPLELAAHLSPFAGHIFPIRLLFDLGTRFAALSLPIMKLIIEIFVCPDAYPLHGTWTTIML